MGFQIGLNLPGNVLDSWLNPSTIGPALAGFGKGVGSALDEAFKGCSDGSCGHAGHKGRKADGDATDTLDDAVYDDYGNLTQATEKTAPDGTTLFKADAAAGAAGFGMPVRSDFPDEPATSGLDSAYKAAMASPSGGVEDDPRIVAFDAEKNPLAGMHAARTEKGREKEMADARRWLMERPKRRAALIHTINMERAAQGREERMASATEASAATARGHLDISTRAENRQTLEDEYKRSQDARQLRDSNDELFAEGQLRTETTSDKSFDPTRPYLVEAEDIRNPDTVTYGIPMTSTKAASDKLAAYRAREKQGAGFKHSDEAREDTQAFTAAENERKRAFDSEVLTKKQAFDALYKKHGDTALEGAKAALAQTTQQINDRFNDALAKFKTKDLETDPEYVGWLSHRQALREFITAHSGGDPLKPSATNAPPAAPAPVAAPAPTTSKTGAVPDFDTVDAAVRKEMNGKPERDIRTEVLRRLKGG